MITLPTDVIATHIVAKIDFVHLVKTTLVSWSYFEAITKNKVSIVKSINKPDLNLTPGPKTWENAKTIYSLMRNILPPFSSVPLFQDCLFQLSQSIFKGSSSTREQIFSHPELIRGVLDHDHLLFDPPKALARAFRNDENCQSNFQLVMKATPECFDAFINYSLTLSEDENLYRFTKKVIQFVEHIYQDIKERSEWENNKVLTFFFETPQFFIERFLGILPDIQAKKEDWLFVLIIPQFLNILLAVKGDDPFIKPRLISIMKVIFSHWNGYLALQSFRSEPIILQALFEAKILKKPRESLLNDVYKLLIIDWEKLEVILNNASLSVQSGKMILEFQRNIFSADTMQFGEVLNKIFITEAFQHELGEILEEVHGDKGKILFENFKERLETSNLSNLSQKLGNDQN